MNPAIFKEPLFYVGAAIFILLMLSLYSMVKKPRPYLKYLFINHLKIKGGNMVVIMNNRQQLVGAVGFVNRRNEPAEVQAGSVTYALKDAEGNDVDPSIATVEKDPENEKQFIVTTGETLAARKLFDVHVSADADLDEGEQTNITGNVLGIVAEPLEAVGAVSATIVVEPHDI